MLRLALFLSVSLAGLISVTPIETQAQSVVDWTMARTTVKVRPNHSMSPQKRYWLMAAKNDFASIQVVLDLSKLPSGGGGSEVCVTKSDLVDGSNKIAESNVHVFRAAPIELDVKSNDEGDTGIFFDPLSFKPNGCQSSETEWATIPLRVLVASFRLPQTSSLTSSIEWSVTEACRAHFGRECNDPDIPTLNALYGRFLLEHRLTPWLSYTPYHGTEENPDYSADWDDYVQKYKPLVEGSDSSFASGRQLKDALVTTIRYPVSGEVLQFDPMDSWWNKLGTAWRDKAFVKVGDEPQAKGNAGHLANARFWPPVACVRLRG